MSQALTGTFAAIGQSASFQPDGIDDRLSTQFNLSLWGTFVASVQLERSFDAGATWLPLTQAGAAAYRYTAPASETVTEPEAKTLYRLNCTAYTSGTVNYRLSE